MNRQPAENAIREAIRLQQDIGAKPEQAHSYVCYARFHQAWGETTSARDYLNQAMAMFRHMGMTWALAQIKPAIQTLL